MPELEGRGPCGLCGADPARGIASVTVKDETVWLCHPNEGRDCYHEWTVYGIRPGEPALVEREVPTTADARKAVEAFNAAAEAAGRLLAYDERRTHEAIAAWGQRRQVKDDIVHDADVVARQLSAYVGADVEFNSDPLPTKAQGTLDRLLEHIDPPVSAVAKAQKAANLDLVQLVLDAWAAERSDPARFLDDDDASIMAATAVQVITKALKEIS